MMMMKGSFLFIELYVVFTVLLGLLSVIPVIDSFAVNYPLLWQRPPAATAAVVAIRSPLLLFRRKKEVSTRNDDLYIICRSTPSSSDDEPSKQIDITSSSDLTESNKQSSTPSSALSSSSNNNENEVDSKGTVMKTILLAVPLFCKFVIVLVVKFLTDLVVFPLLFLYRLARLGKRRILRMFRGGGSNGKPNNSNSNNNREYPNGERAP